MSEKIKVWVVVHPDGNITWQSAFDTPCRSFRHAAISDACRYARFHAEEKYSSEHQKKTGKWISVEWGNLSWDQAKRQGFRVKRATLSLDKPK